MASTNSTREPASGPPISTPFLLADMYRVHAGGCPRHRVRCGGATRYPSGCQGAVGKALPPSSRQIFLADEENAFHDLKPARCGLQRKIKPNRRINARLADPAAGDPILNQMAGLIEQSSDSAADRRGSPAISSCNMPANAITPRTRANQSIVPPAAKWYGAETRRLDSKSRRRPPRLRPKAPR